MHDRFLYSEEIQHRVQLPRRINQGLAEFPLESTLLANALGVNCNDLLDAIQFETARCVNWR